MEFSETPVYIDGGAGKFFGIFHPAHDGNMERGFVFANSGMQNRVGPHRLYVKFARVLARAGYNVLRIDFPGIGESDGEIQETHFDAHNPEYTIQAIDFMVKEKKIRSIGLFGLCAGARNVVKAAAMDERVKTLVSWSVPIVWMPPTYPSPLKDPRGYMSRKGAYMTIVEKGKKAMTLRGWQNYFRKGGDIRKVFLYIRSILWNLFADEKKWTNIRHRNFFDSLENYIRADRKALFLYGEKDEILISEFKQKLEEFRGRGGHNCSLVVIPGGNHSLTAIRTEIEAIKKTVTWLNDNI